MHGQGSASAAVVPHDLETFAAAITGCGRGTLIGAATRLEPDPRPLVRLFQAGAIIALADETATAAAVWEPTPRARPARCCSR